MTLSVPSSLHLPGLEAVDGHSPAERRHSLAQLDDDELARRLVAAMAALRDQAAATHEFGVLATLTGAPHGEVVASPFGLRAVALAADAGAALVHHELRDHLGWPHDADVAEETLDPDHGTWSRGVLLHGKYQGFLQDDPFAAFNPGHMAKWTPHELLHRAAAFCWREGQSRWELYLGARLNELVPVVLWYGVDQIGRRATVPFDRTEWSARPASPREDARWLDADDAELLAIARAGVPLLRAGLAHFEAELAAIDAELAGSGPVRVPHAFLDASSDAIAYAAAHAGRLASRSVTRCFARLLRDGRDVFAHAGDYRDAVEQLHDALLFGTFTLDARRAAARRDARLLRDVLQRAAHLGWSTFRRLVPDLESAAAELDAAEDGRAPDLARWRERIADRVGLDVCERLFSTGLPAELDPSEGRLPARSLAILRDGLDSIVPRATADIEECDPNALGAFAGSLDLWSRAPLAERLRRLVERREMTAPMLEVEVAIAAADGRADTFVEHLCEQEALPEDLDEAQLHASRAFRVETLDPVAVAEHSGSDAVPDPPPSAFLVGGYREGVSIVPVWPPIADAWAALAERPVSAETFVAELEAALNGGAVNGSGSRGRVELPADFPADAEEWLAELLDAGAVGWVPRVSDR